MLLRFFAFLLAALAVSAAAQAPAPSSVAGSWALQFEGTTIFRFDVEQAGDSWKGTWWRPRTFGIGPQGDTFYQVSGPPVEVPSGEGKTIGEWTELSFPDNRPGAVPDVFRFRMLGEDRAEALYVGTGLPAFVLIRVPAGSVAGPWEPERTYRRPTVASLGLPPDINPEITRPQPTATPEAKTFSLPPRRTDSPPAVGGR